MIVFDVARLNLAEHGQRSARGYLPEGQNPERHPDERAGHAEGGQRRLQQQVQAHDVGAQRGVPRGGVGVGQRTQAGEPDGVHQQVDLAQLAPAGPVLGELDGSQETNLVGCRTDADEEPAAVGVLNDFNQGDGEAHVLWI